MEVGCGGFVLPMMDKKLLNNKVLKTFNLLESTREKHGSISSQIFTKTMLGIYHENARTSGENLVLALKRQGNFFLQKTTLEKSISFADNAYRVHSPH